MASSRIFIKGLPPGMTQEAFKRHFSSINPVTDARIYPDRRIGFVGYETSEDAQKAVRYFNRTFIRMSRLTVEIARSPRDAKGEDDGSAQRDKKEKLGGAGEIVEGSRKRKREVEFSADDEKQLKEFLDVVAPKAKRKAAAQAALDAHGLGNDDAKAAATQSDDEYEEVPKRAKVTRESSKKTDPSSKSQELNIADSPGRPTEDAEPAPNKGNDVSDADWARSKTSRLLGLVDDDEESPENVQLEQPDSDPELEEATSNAQAFIAEKSIPTPPSDDFNDEAEESVVTPAIKEVRSSMRLFVRNLPYDTKDEDLEREFEAFGNLEEVHVAIDKKTGTAKGFAFVQFSDPDAAEAALQEVDGKTFCGRLIHVLPASAKQDNKLDDFALSKLPLKKQQQIKKRREATTKPFNWNALYMNADAVVSSVADRLGLSKSDILDPTSSDAAVRQAHAETHVIQETKAFFQKHGVDLDAFKKKQRGDTAILVKNIPYDCSQDELKRRFEEHGEVKKFLMAPSNTVAIVEFAHEVQCKAAFSALAYRRIKSSMLFLEKAPKGLFDGKEAKDAVNNPASDPAKTSASELKEANQNVPDATVRATLYVRNLNFSTTTSQLNEAFQPADGFLSAVVKTKTNPKDSTAPLSMGFGFVEFRTSQQAQQALQIMDGTDLHGHKLQIRTSHKGADAAEQRRADDVAKKTAGKKTKIIIKNLPFEATKKDVRSLFGAYGQLRSVRVPKRMDRAARGFGFADFLTPKEAQSAMEALRHTHLLGRRLVLDFAEEEPEDAEAEIEKMQAKVGAQTNKVALRKLTSGGRKKFTTQNDEEGGD